MTKKIAGAVLMAVFAVGAVACKSGPEQGAAERAGSNAGRVIDDSVITGKVKTALIKDPATKAHQIQVETFQGTVQLSGFVDDANARRRAGEVARNIEGVRQVKNTLELRDPS